MPRRTAGQPLGAELEAIVAKVIAVTGLDYYADKREALGGHIARLAAENNLGTADYAHRLLQPAGSALFARLVDEVTIGETYFFRYPQQDTILKDIVIPACLERRRRERRLTIWSAGCASGAEPYSLAILLHTAFGRELAGWDVTILGTDINRRALDRARTGHFSEWELRTADEAERKRHFTRQGKAWAIREQYRQWVQFRHQNLNAEIDAFADANRGAFDLVLCRNVLIYFAPDLIRKCLRGAHACLSDAGWLLVGHAEPHFEIATLFTPILHSGATAYAKGMGTPAPLHNPRARPIDAVPPPQPARVDREPAPPPVEPPPPPCVPATATVATDPAPAAPPDAEAELAGIRAHTDSGDWAAAMAACEGFVERRPLEPGGHYTLALIAEHMGRQDEAESALRRTLYLDRNLALAHYHLGRCLMLRGQRRPAERAFANALRSVAAAEDGARLALGDGLTVAELRDLVSFHLALAEGAPT